MTDSIRVSAGISVRLVLLVRSSDFFFVLTENDSKLPYVQIPSFERLADQLRRTVEATWNIVAQILDICNDSDHGSRLAFVRVLASPAESRLSGVAVDTLLNEELSPQQHDHLKALLTGASVSPFSRFAWMDDALDWIQSVTGQRIDCRRIEHCNVGDGFALFCFASERGEKFWLKATGHPNTHEFGIVRFLSLHCSNFIPRLVAMREDWNAWLTEDAGNPLGLEAGSKLFAPAAQAFAFLQLKTVSLTDAFLKLGATDHRLPILQNHLEGVMTFLADAMSRQSSSKVPTLSDQRLIELGRIISDACSALSNLAIPDTLLHNDLNQGNILHDGARCAFNDWSEAAVGCPFLSLARLCRLFPAKQHEIQGTYCSKWREHLSESTIQKACAISPLLAIYAYLYGRGAWIQESTLQPRFESYARSLARHMDRAACEPAFIKAVYS